MVRTSRVHAASSSVYRNTKRFLHADEMFADTMNNGMQQRDPREQFAQQQKKNKKSATKAKKQLVKTKARLIVKGIQFDGDSAIIRNQLIHNSLKVNTMSKLKKRNVTYRTSI